MALLMKFYYHGNKKILLFVLRSQWNQNEGRDPAAQARKQGGPRRPHPIGGRHMFADPPSLPLPPSPPV